MFARAILRRAALLSSRQIVSAATAHVPVSRLPVLMAVAGATTLGLGAQFAFTATAECQKVDYDAVRGAIRGILDRDGYDDGSIGPLLVRLAWHAAGTYDVGSGTGGSCGGMMRFEPEKNWGANAGLDKARAFLEPIKQQFPGITYADLWSLAGTVAIEEMGGPKLEWRAGRPDYESGARSPPDGRLPDATKGNSHLRDIFYRMGFNDRDIVALSGAHSMGRCHADRSGFVGPWTRAPTTFSNQYFVELVDTKWTPKPGSNPMQYQDPTGDLMMLPTDVCMMDDAKFRPIIQEYAKNEAAFFADFASAWTKLQHVGMPSACCKKKSSNSSYSGLLVSGTLATAAFFFK